MEDLGPILAVLSVTVNANSEPLKNRSCSFIQNPKNIENGRDMAITVFGFRSTLNEVSVEAGPTRLITGFKIRIARWVARQPRKS